MNKIIKKVLTASMLTIVTVPVTQASSVTYNVEGAFYEPQTQGLGGDTVFKGTFNWDGSVVSNLHGTMNSSMYITDNINPDYNQTFPLMNLNYQLAESIDGDIVTATVFLENTTEVFSGTFGGGYEAGGILRYGHGSVFGLQPDGNTPNDNAYFTFSFDKTTMVGILEEMVYADCTAGGMMHESCMTGHSIAKVGYSGTMSAVPSSINISQVSAVPVPAAVWLFGSAFLGMIGVTRKRTLSV